MTTTTERESLWARATMPYALSGLAYHLLDYPVPAPQEIDVRDGRITLWMLAAHIDAWRTAADFADETTTTQARTRDHAYDIHIADAVLHGSGVKVTFRWTTPSDAAICQGIDSTCLNIVGDSQSDEPGCTHGNALCSEHRMECQHCREDLADDRPFGYDGGNAS